MSVPTVLPKGCSLDGNYNGISSTTHLDLQFIHGGDICLQPLGSLPVILSRDRQGHNVQDTTGSCTHSLINATGTQVKLLNSASRRRSLRSGSAQSNITTTSQTPNLRPHSQTTTSAADDEADASTLNMLMTTTSLDDAPVLARLEQVHQPVAGTCTPVAVNNKSQPRDDKDKHSASEHSSSTESSTGSERVSHKSSKKKKKKKRKGNKASKKCSDTNKHLQGRRSKLLQPLQAMCVSVSLQPAPPTKPRPSVTQPAFPTKYSHGPSPYSMRASTSLTPHKMNSSSDSALPRKSTGCLFLGGAAAGPSAPLPVSLSQDFTRVYKVYLSDRQSKNMQQLGAEFPCPPPCTPLPDSNKMVEYVASLSDVRAQREVRARLEAMERVQLHRLQKRKQEKEKQEKQQQQQQQKELQRRQRSEIYALNKVMTELENRHFEAFMAQRGKQT